MTDNTEGMRLVGRAIASIFEITAGHKCDFVLVAFPDGQADWLLSHSEKDPSALIALYRRWLWRFVEDGPKERAAKPDEIAVSMGMREIAEIIGVLLFEKTGNESFALVVFPNDVGMYCANIARYSAKTVMVELLEQLERKQ